MFERIRMRGTAGSISWGYRTAAQLSSWRISYHRPDVAHDGRWTLTATFTRVDKPMIRERPLLFTATKTNGMTGLWTWPLDSASIQIGETKMTAILGPPELGD